MDPFNCILTKCYLFNKNKKLIFKLIRKKEEKEIN